LVEIDKLIDQTIKLRNNERFVEAIEVLENSYKKHPESVNIKRNLIETLFIYGGHLNDEFNLDIEKAIGCFKRIIEIEPNNYRALYNLGIAYFNLSQMNNALEAYNKALKIKPDYKYCLYNMGLVHEATNEFKEALKYYEKALEIDPNFSYAVHARYQIRKKLDDLQRDGLEIREQKDRVQENEKIAKINRYCPICGSKIREQNAKFCHHCGARVKDN